MIKIAVMLRHLKEVGGIKVYTVNLLKNLLRLDQVNEYFFLYKDEDPLGSYHQYSNVRERVVKAPSKFLWDQVAVPRIARKENVDIIFNPKLSIPLFAAQKTVFPLHGLEQFAVPEAYPCWDRWYTRLMMPLFCRSTDAIVSMTYKGAKEMERYLKIKSEKVHVIPEAYDLRFRVLPSSEVERVRQKYHLPQKFILFVGGLFPVKNFGNLLRSFQQVQSKFPDHYLVAVGFQRWKFKDDLALIKKLNLESRVILPGYIPDEDLPSFYNRAQAFVFPSLYEGFGIPILEAMACGCPVITTRTGCSPEVAGDAAFLINPKNPQEIALAIEKVLIDSTLRQNLIQAGLKRAADFRWEKTARLTLALFEKMAGVKNKLPQVK
ncbi:MAG: glycosyltransferase family 4 protein [Chlamydiae bacterium]|nr:glycosyltransferase family 4 protein [Chlamydiota bacterium]MBI3276598.1 glycosyltransferase family 4 protein [Chlamydiota bacterium]